MDNWLARPRASYQQEDSAMAIEATKEFDKRAFEAMQRVIGKPRNLKNVRLGFTEIVNARKMFDPAFEKALRELGFSATIQRKRVWIEGPQAFFFDLTRQKSLRRFLDFRRDVLARTAGLKK